LKTPLLYKNTFIVVLVFFVFSSFIFQNKLNAQEVNEDDFIIVDEMPRFPGCEDLDSRDEKVKCAEKQMMEYIYSQLKYPEDAIKKNIEGKVILRFGVTKNGKIEGVEILKDIGGGCGEESKRVVESMNDMHEKWIPGKKDNQNVKVWFALPIVFKLNNDLKNSNSPKFNNQAYMGENTIPCDQGPIFPLCTNLPTRSEMEECSPMRMMEYIYSILNYPVEARKKRIEGRVTVKFTVMKEGKIGNVEILRDIGGGCGEEVKRVIESMNTLSEKWIPGSQGSENVDVYFTIPVIFKLNG